MDNRDRKRVPLGSLSPTTLRSFQKRRTDPKVARPCSDSEMLERSLENTNPNCSHVANTNNDHATTIVGSTNERISKTRSRINGLVRQNIIGNDKESTTKDVDVNTPQIHKCPSGMRHSPLTAMLESRLLSRNKSCKTSAGVNSSSASSKFETDSISQKLTPSERRFLHTDMNSLMSSEKETEGTIRLTGNNIRARGFNATPSPTNHLQTNGSGRTNFSPMSSLINRNSTKTTRAPLFQLPASRIIPKAPIINSSQATRIQLTHQPGKICDTINADKGKHKKHGENSSYSSRSFESDTVAGRNQDDIIVVVPEFEDIGIRRPVWYSSTEGTTARNLNKDFNLASQASCLTNVNATVPNKTTNVMVSDSDDDENITDHIPHVYVDANTDDFEKEVEEEPIRGEHENEDEKDSIKEKPDLWAGYMNIGPPTKICHKCKSIMWNEERNNKGKKYQEPTFSLCCRDGQVCLDKEKQTPSVLSSLLSGNEKSSHFLKNIRAYNAMFQFTSLGGKVDNRINNGKAPWCFKLYGQNHHLLGTLKPMPGQTPKFCQLYIYDTDSEIENRINAVNGADQLDPEIVKALLQMLDENNKLVKGFRMARDRFKKGEQEEFRLQLIHSRSVSGRTNHIIESNDVAALIVGDAEECSPFRDIIVETKQRYLKRVFETCAHFMQLQYPLLFPYGDEGFNLNIPLKNKKGKIPVTESNEDLQDENVARTNVSMREYYAYKLMIRPDEGMTMHLSGCLWQQFVVDAFAAVEQYRLDWMKKHQHIIRSDLYRSIRDRVAKGDADPTSLGQNVILPATFTGSQRYMNQYFKDSLAICRTIGHPSLFLTMTCNTQWPEIQSMLEHLPNVDANNAPDVIARVFKMKLDQLIDLIKKKNYFGRCIGVMHVVEFQKRGLPHTHMLIWLHPNDRPKSIAQIDKLISAEIPDENVDPIGYHIVKNFMIHGPCGSLCKDSPCMVKGNCIRHFPKRFNPSTFFDDSGFPQYRRRNQEFTVKRKGVHLNNQYVVPYNRDLLVRFHCHINLEVCNNSRSLKYLFKYCLKGHDTATMLLKKKISNDSNVTDKNRSKSKNEIKQYLDGRYVCAVEAAWRLFGFEIHYRYPSVERLPVHCPGEKNVTFKSADNMQNVVENAEKRNSKLEGWFVANNTIREARNYTYMEFPQAFTWKADECRWKERQRGNVIGRVIDIHASSGETFFLRMLLMQNKGATSFSDLRTVNGKLHATFKDACHALGLLQDDNQWHYALSENAHCSMPRQVRELFVHILTNNSVADPSGLWEKNWKAMSDDVLYNRRRLTNNPNLQLPDNEIYNYALAEIEKLLNDVGKSLKDYNGMPYPEEEYRDTYENRLIAEEIGYDKTEMKNQHEKLFPNLNKDQLEVYNSIVSSVDKGEGGLFFVYGSGGCGKTFLWKTLCCALRSQSKIVLPVASSGIAATLLPGGRTAHSRFHIPIKLDQYSTAGVKHGTDIAELMQNTSLIIWDEAPMQHRHAFESVDRCLRDIMSTVHPDRATRPFGGITVVFGGDFRQILPVIPKAPRGQVVSSSFNRSKLWDHCKVFLLSQNMRLSSGKTDEENRIVREFSNWVLAVGNGEVPLADDSDPEINPNISIPSQFLINSPMAEIKDIVDVIYPNFVEGIKSVEYLRNRSILTPTNVVVGDINDYLLDQIPGDFHTYYSQNSLSDTIGMQNDFQSSFPVEYLNSINMPCLPKHELKLKVGSVVMLMRNLNQIMGLCNGTRMIVKKCMKNSILCEILCGSEVGTLHIIPRIEMQPSDTKWPIDFKRVQFPLQVCFAMTINKSQGQSLDKVGLYLPRSVFTHGQLYVAISRVTSPSGLHILIFDDSGRSTNVTANVVYEEVFYNLPTVND